MIQRLGVFLALAGLPCLAPYNMALSRCPVPFRPSPAIVALAHREGFDRPDSLASSAIPVPLGSSITSNSPTRNPGGVRAKLNSIPSPRLRCSKRGNLLGSMIG